MKTRIAELRKEKNMTLKELGTVLGIRDNTLSQYETGKRNPQLGLLQEIANFFHVSLEYLTCDTDKRDYQLESDSDAISLLKSISDPKTSGIGQLNLSNETALKLAIWIETNFDLLKNDYPDLINTAHTLVHTVQVENRVLKVYSADRKKRSKQIDKIIDELENDDDVFTSPKQVLAFIDESKRLTYKQIEQVINYMKDLPNENNEI